MTVAKLLIIDDDSDFRESMVLALELEGYEVDTATNGRDGIEAVQANVYDVILIDVGMPGLNGVVTLAQIKELNSTARCFLLTGYSAGDLLDQGLKAGAVEILKKPIFVDALLQKIAAAQSD